FSFTDGTSAKPEYPAGSCTGTYNSPPGFPTDLTVNGIDGGPSWGGGASSVKGHDAVAWQDVATGLPSGFAYLGDLVTIDDSMGNHLYSSGSQPQGGLSPLMLMDSLVPIGSCDAFA